MVDPHPGSLIYNKEGGLATRLYTSLGLAALHYVKTSIRGTKLAPLPKLPSAKVAATETKRMEEAEPEPAKQEEKVTAMPQTIKKARIATTQKKVWEVKSSATEGDSNTNMPDFP